MSKVDKILCIIFGVLMIACLVLEFVPVVPLARQIVVAITAVYALGCLIYFEVRKHKAIK